MADSSTLCLPWCAVVITAMSRRLRRSADLSGNGFPPLPLVCSGNARLRRVGRLGAVVAVEDDAVDEAAGAGNQQRQVAVLADAGVRAEAHVEEPGKDIAPAAPRGEVLL